VASVPCILFEDEHLLVVNKPAGWNTHAPSATAGEGLYDWLRHREPRWAQLAVVHRLDKETSGVMVLSKSTLANRSLTEQFSRRTVRKRYLLLTDRRPPAATLVRRSELARAGARYTSRPPGTGGVPAETRFRIVAANASPWLIEAEPVTGRTHQIRVHAAEAGFPILGDVLYGGSRAPRLCLHAAQLELCHPATGHPRQWTVPPAFTADPPRALRAAFLDSAETTACRWIHGAADGWPGWYVDRLGSVLLSQSEAALTERQRERLVEWLAQERFDSVYHKRLSRRLRMTPAASLAPSLVFGNPAPHRVDLLENGVRFAVGLEEGYSVGLFLDQRDNRRRLLVNHVCAGLPAFEAGPAQAEVLNTFAYTCGFSVCAALAGARTTSVDLSRNYLEWGQDNFRRNGLAPATHTFLRGDAFDWLRRFQRQGRQFALVLLDPPTFSTSKIGGRFQVERDLGRLVAAALPAVQRGGRLFVSSNAARLSPADFLESVSRAVAAGGRTVARQHYVPQPPDFPVGRDEPAYLKTVWLCLE